MGKNMLAFTKTRFECAVCFWISSQPPRKDVQRMLAHGDTQLKFKLRLVDVDPIHDVRSLDPRLDEGIGSGKKNTLPIFPLKSRLFKKAVTMTMITKTTYKQFH